jgi:hypothetical protein
MRLVCLSNGTWQMSNDGYEMQITPPSRLEWVVDCYW